MKSDRNARSPLRQVLRAYDRAIDACDARDEAGAHKSIELLRVSLDMESAESIGFDGIFGWCQRGVASGDFDGPRQRLAALREAWKTAGQLRATPGITLTPRRALRIVRGRPDSS